MSVRVVFLDFDGVLNCKQYFEASPDHEDSEAGALDPLAIARLNRLLAATGALVVVSSSWRHLRSIEQLTDLLCLRGFTSTVHDKTGDAPEDGVWSQRGDEIQSWLGCHPEVTSYVVLDDHADMDAVRERFIQTDSHGGGLLDHHVERAIAMLRETTLGASEEVGDDG